MSPRERWARGGAPTRTGDAPPPKKRASRKREPATDADYLAVLPAEPDEGLTLAEIVEAVGADRASRERATEALARLEDRGEAERMGEGKKGSPYRYGATGG